MEFNCMISLGVHLYFLFQFRFFHTNVSTWLLSSCGSLPHSSAKEMDKSRGRTLYNLSFTSCKKKKRNCFRGGSSSGNWNVSVRIESAHYWERALTSCWVCSPLNTDGWLGDCCLQLQGAWYNSALSVPERPSHSVQNGGR